VLYVDCETVGLVGPCVLIQWAIDDGPIHLHEVWRETCGDTVRLIESFTEHEVCGWNLTFDWFHCHRTLCVLRLLPQGQPPTPAGWREVERRAIGGPCVKPRSALDLFLYARKTDLQALMERSPVKIRRVPKALAPLLAEELESRVDFESIFFARRRDGYKWNVEEFEDRPDLPDVTLRFGARMGLKPVSRHLLGAECMDLPVERSKLPKDEREWNPLDPEPWRHLLAYHATFWGTNEKARHYATDDVDLLRRLRKYWGNPPAGDDDSVLACQVACSRWRGFAIDAPMVETIRDGAELRKQSAPRAPKTVLHGLKTRLSEVEALCVTDTGAKTLEWIAREHKGQRAGDFASDVIRARSAEKLVTDCNKLLTAGRLHPNAKIIGAKSGRMSGAGGFNVQGISKQELAKLGDADAADGASLREAFPLADGNLPVLDGGDFDAFEVSILEACAADPALREAIQSGKKFHAVFGAELYGASYDEILADVDRYTRAKSAVFASVYGAQIPKVADVLGLPVEQTEAGYERFMARYPGVRREQQLVFDSFCSMRQPGGLGTRVEWHEPQDSIESLFGFKRSFALENRVAHALFELAQNVPSDWRRLKAKVSRRKERTQTAGGAVMSALYGAAFQIQAKNMRAAGNHRIQSTGAQITKRLQRRIWDEQPAGVHPWKVSPLNIHDEVMCPRAEGVDLRPVVADVLDFYRPTVPLIAMEWKSGMPNWGAK
jgi:hypothetical protein